MKIHVIQPAIPKYREKFFQMMEKEFDVCFYTAKKDFLGVESTFRSNNVLLMSRFFLLSKKFYWHQNLSLFKEYKKGDIVIINGNPRIINYMLLFLFLKIRCIKTVWWGHGWSAGSYGLSSKIRFIIMRFLADFYLFYTEKEREEIMFDNSFALNNGLDSDVYSNLIIKMELKRSFPSELDDFYIVFVGRITEKSNFKMLLNSLLLLPKRIKLNVIGGSDDFDSYVEYSKKIGVFERVVWFGPIYDEVYISKIMMASHVFVYPGAVGLSLIHAFNYGLPAVLHSDKTLHMPEFSAFQHGYNGLSFESGNLQDMVSNILKIYLMSYSDYQMLSSNALSTIKTSYNINDMYVRLKKLIEAITC
ncbi:glycosyltransferase [uncultured Tolumonas sp.]|uniref:glycosyltransferase n=1 Tax=uncultured Tolumonas sp. TaxID=263765 RepID=UPI002A0A2D4F|nr:glycosyltransferase [uncultured Tolumonas sp.]